MSHVTFLAQNGCSFSNISKIGGPFLFFSLLDFVVPIRIFPVGNSDRFPQGKPAATESRYPTLINYKVHAGSFRVSVIHRTLTGSLTCVRDHSYACV